MYLSTSRRTVLTLAPLGLTSPLAFAAESSTGPALPATYPAQSPDVVREMVSVSHGNMKRVRELVAMHPSLAKAGWDWGFGDWETALGAASHVGNREIAEFLIEQGAVPTLFSATMLGQTNVVKAMIAAQPGSQRIAGPHSISLLAHARNGGAAATEVLRLLQELGDADAPPTVPLTEADRVAISGNYSFGTAPTEKIEISSAKSGLVFRREGTTARNLFHLGERVFHPAGAAAVRIRFSEVQPEMTLSVYDPDVILTARRAKT